MKDKYIKEIKKYERAIFRKLVYLTHPFKAEEYAKIISKIPCPKCKELEEECIKNDGYRVMKLEESISDKDKKISKLKDEVERLSLYAPTKTTRVELDFDKDNQIK